MSKTPRVNYGCTLIFILLLMVTVIMACCGIINHGDWHCGFINCTP